MSTEPADEVCSTSGHLSKVWEISMHGIIDFQGGRRDFGSSTLPSLNMFEFQYS